MGEWVCEAVPIQCSALVMVESGVREGNGIGSNTLYES